MEVEVHGACSVMLSKLTGAGPGEGYGVVLVMTPHGEVEVLVSPTGRSVTVRVPERKPFKVERRALHHVG